MANLREAAWAFFDAIVAAAPLRAANPWHGPPGGREAPAYVPDYDTLRLLLGVPVHLAASSQSGVPALALDVWIAYEFRRAGFDADRLWPRPRPPRVLPGEIIDIIERLPERERQELRARIERGLGGASSAQLLGKNYVKQVDVGMSSWATGPELMVSTKRMDSSFGKNAANRVEESYGDAKNLRLRHPQAAFGFVYALSATALQTEPDIAAWLIDLLGKLGREDDAYDAVALVLPESAGAPGATALADGTPADEDEQAPPSGPLEPGIEPTDAREDPTEDAPDASDAPDELMLLPMDVPTRTAPDLTRLPLVSLRHDEVPAELDPARFFGVMCRRILDNSPINFHREARARWRSPSPWP